MKTRCYLLCFYRDIQGLLNNAIVKGLLLGFFLEILMHYYRVKERVLVYDVD